MFCLQGRESTYLRGNLIEAHDFLLEDEKEAIEKGRTERRKGKGGRKEHSKEVEGMKEWRRGKGKWERETKQGEKEG